MRNDWESNFFKREIHNFDELSAIEKAAPPKGSLQTIKALSSDEEMINAANRLGFQYCEGDVKFHCKITQALPQTDNHLQVANSTHLESLSRIVCGLYTHSRFKQPWFKPEEKDQFYARWVENAVKAKHDDVCLVDQNGEDIKGFVTLKAMNQNARIGLIGVSSSYRGQAVGHKLIDAAKIFCQQRSIESLEVSTQLSNKAAIKLYESHSFKYSDSHLWFYKQS